MSSLMMWCSQGRLTSKKFNWHAVAVALPKKKTKNNMYSSLNIEGLQEEEHGVLCAACHYYTHVDWCKLIGSIAPFLLVCWLKEMGYLIWKWTCCCCSYLQSLFHIISITIKRINLLKLHPLTKKTMLIFIPCVRFWLNDEDLILRAVVSAAKQQAARRERNASDREKTQQHKKKIKKMLQFTAHDIVFYVIHRNLPSGVFTSLKSRTICRASSKGILVFAVAY